jgi:hypothetical protein
MTPEQSEIEEDFEPVPEVIVKTEEMEKVKS